MFGEDKIYIFLKYIYQSLSILLNRRLLMSSIHQSSTAYTDEGSRADDPQSDEDDEICVDETDDVTEDTVSILSRLHSGKKIHIHEEKVIKYFMDFFFQFWSRLKCLDGK